MRSLKKTCFVLSMLFVLFINGLPVRADNSEREVKIMTYNMYLGADLSGIFDPTLTLQGVFFEVGEAFSDVQAGNVPERIDEIADQIAAGSPDMVGLQEVALWRYGTFGDPADSETVAYDFLQMLIDRLEARGAHYRAISVQTNLDAELPAIISQTDVRDIRYTDRDVIIARTDLPTSELKIENTSSGTFQVLLPIPFLEGQIIIPRGWTTADVKHRGKVYRFVNAHTEAFNDTVQYYQTLEVLGGPTNTPGNVVLVGDFNSDAATAGASYTLLLSGGLTDVWSVLRPGTDGFTWPLYYENPSIFQTPSQRLDLVLTRGDMTFSNIDVVGESEVTDLTVSGLRPSDHAGVTATLVLQP